MFFASPLALAAAPTVVTLEVNDEHAPDGQEADDQDERLDVQLLQRAAEQLPGRRVQFRPCPGRVP